MPVAALHDLEAIGSPMDDLEPVGPAPGEKTLGQAIAELPGLPPPVSPEDLGATLRLPRWYQQATFPQISAGGPPPEKPLAEALRGVGPYTPPVGPAAPAAGLNLPADYYSRLIAGMTPEQYEQQFLGPKGLGGQLSETGEFIGGAGKATVADVAAGLRALKTGAREAAPFSGNIPAWFAGEEMPVDVALRAAAEESKVRGEFPVAATVGHVATGLAETLPLIIGGAELPALGQKILGTAFAANMLLRDAPQVAKALGDELGKPPEQRDPDRIAQLYAQAAQIIGFTGLTAAAAKRVGRNIAISPRDAYAILERQTRGPMLAEPLRAGPTRELGVRLPGEVAMGPMFSPEAQRLAGEVIRERVQPGVVVPGQVPAIELLRREVEGLSPVTRALAERPGGGPATGGQISFAGRAEAGAIPSARQAALLQTIESGAALPQPPNVVQRIMAVVNNKDRLSLEQMREDIAGGEKTPAREPGIGTRSQANDVLRVINQRLEELRTGKPHRENEAIRQIINRARQEAVPPEQRPLPTVETYPPPSGKVITGGGRTAPEFTVRPATGKNVGRFEIEGLGTFPSQEHAQGFADRLAKAGVSRAAVEEAYRAGGQGAVNNLLLRAEGRQPSKVISGTSAETWADETINRSKSMGVRPTGAEELLAAYAIKGAAILERGIRNFAEWSTEMVRQFGETIRPHLQKLWTDSNQYIEKGLPDAIKERQEPSGVRRERVGDGARGAPAEAGPRGGVSPAAEGEAPAVSAARRQISDQAAMDATAFVRQFGKGTEGLTARAYQLGEQLTAEDVPALEAARDAAVTRMRELQRAGDLQTGMAEGMRNQYFSEALKWRQALDEAKQTGAKTVEEFGAIEQKHGVGGVRRGEDLMDAAQRAMRQTPEFRQRVYDAILEDLRRSTDSVDLERAGGQIMSAEQQGAISAEQAARLNRIFLARHRGTVGDVLGPMPKESEIAAAAEPTVEAVTALEPSSGAPLSATDALINKLEALKLPGKGQRRLYSVPHPDAIRAIGRTAWNQAIDVAIGAIRAGRAIAEAINEAITHLRRNVRDFNEQQTRANLDYVVRGETGAAPGAAAPPRRRISASLDDIYKIFQPEKPQRPSILDRLDATWEALRTGFSSRFRPLDKLAEDIAAIYGGGTRAIAHIFEQLKGASGKAEADVYRFDQTVSKLIGKNTADFNAYMFLRRSLDRLYADLRDIQRAQAGEEVPRLNRRQVADYIIPELEAKLNALKNKLGPEQLRNFEGAAGLYQQHMDAALQLQVISGRMSPELYQAIKRENQFYAPFKLLKYLEESSRPPGTGRQIDTLAEYTKAMTGIEDPNFKLGDMLAAARQNIVLSRVLAEKNMTMRKFAEIADLDRDKLFVQKLGPSEEAPFGKEIVNVKQDGQTVRYAVDRGIADAVKLYNTQANEVMATWLRLSSIAFRAGATTFNIAFQARNLLLADLPRSALEAKTGIWGQGRGFRFATTLARDAFLRFPLDFVQSFLSSMEANLLHRENKLYLDFLDSGAAGAVIQDYLTPEVLRARTARTSLPRHIARSILLKPAEFAKAIEETNKLLGLKRAMRIHGVESGRELAAQFPEAVTEVRRFSGSPDFGRMGKYTEAARLNLIFMFLNARIQGAVADIGRLAGRDGARQAAATWVRMGAVIGIPTALSYYFNNLPQYKADYDARPKNEKDNYWLIPKDSFITDDQGNKMRDYWRIPKREAAQIMANLVESGMSFAEKRDPQAFWGFAVDAMENLSPLNIRGDTLQERMESMVSSLNPMFKAPLEMGTGRDTFRHRDIVPDTMVKAPPEKQYLERTPTLYRKLADLMPDVAPEALRSPLMLENLTQNLTAGLIQQFLPSRNIPGRTGVEKFPLLRGFQAAPYAENPEEMKAIKALQREAAGDFLDKDRAARAAITGQTNITDIAKAVAAKYGMNPNSEAIFERATDLWLAEKNGITRPERQVLALPVDQRAKWVLQKLQQLDPQGKVELLIDYERKRILTEGVMNAMVEQMEAARATTSPTNHP